LRPGLRAVRRDSRHLQVGIDPADRLVLPDDAQARALLAALEAGRRPDLDDPRVRRWCRELVERGLVVDADALDRALSGPLPREAVLAAFAVDALTAAQRLTARGSGTAALDATEPWRTAALRAMSSAGVAVVAPGGRPVVHLLVDPFDEILDELMRRSEPHLVVTSRTGRITLGPFVSPGLTACSRCITAHRCDRDPGFATVREQYGHPVGSSTPSDPVLVQLAAAWAVRDLVTYLEGDLPASWSTTIAIDTALTLDRQRWLRHPACGCHWGEELAAG
jgi:hypothetical protein